MAGGGSDNYKSNERAEMKSAKKGKKQGRARHLDGPFAHFTIVKIGREDYGMDSLPSYFHFRLLATEMNKF